MTFLSRLKMAWRFNKFLYSTISIIFYCDVFRTIIGCYVYYYLYICKRLRLQSSMYLFPYISILFCYLTVFPYHLPFIQYFVLTFSRDFHFLYFTIWLVTVWNQATLLQITQFILYINKVCLTWTHLTKTDKYHIITSFSK